MLPNFFALDVVTIVCLLRPMLQSGPGILVGRMDDEDRR
jgi:hypothetical protein